MHPLRHLTDSSANKSGSITTVLSATAILMAVWGAISPAAAQDAGEILLDRVVAVVDEDPILLSDIQRAIGLGFVDSEPEDGASEDGETADSERQRHRRVLDGLIDQSLRLHEVERHDFSQLPTTEIDEQVARIGDSFDDPNELERRLGQLGLTDEGLRLLVTRQLRVLIYIERRLGPRIFVKPGDIRAYYDDVLVAEMAARDIEPPAFGAIQEQIRELLREQRLNEEIEAWTEELRQGADIEDYLERSDTGLPPIVQRLE